MLAKALLSVVGALFIGSQLVHASELTTCPAAISTDCVSPVPEDKYCILDGVIYGYGEGQNPGTIDCTTKSPVTDEYNVFLGDVLLGTNEVTVANKANLKIYHCTGVTKVNCKQTFGYVLANDQYLTIHKDGSNDFKALEGLTAIAGDSLDACNVGALYNVGSTGQKLCLSNTPNVFSQDISTPTAKSYVLNNVANNVFTNVESGTEDIGKPIIVQVGGGKIVLSNSGYDYCPEDDYKEVKETFNEFCGSDYDPCNGNPYECNINGVCTRQTEQCVIKEGSNNSPNCKDGYYIVSKTPVNEVYDPVGNVGDEGQLFVCNNKTCKPKSTGFAAGYYKNKAEGNVIYIACKTQSSCTAVGVSYTCDAVGNIINVSGDLKLCLDVNVPSGVLGNATGSHFISINAGNVFGDAATGKYVEVVFDKDNNIVTLAASQVNRKYVYTDGNYKIYAKGQKDNVCVSGGTLIEFKENSGYEKHAETKRPVVASG